MLKVSEGDISEGDFCNSFQSWGADNWKERRRNEEITLGETREIWAFGDKMDGTVIDCIQFVE